MQRVLMQSASLICLVALSGCGGETAPTALAPPVVVADPAPAPAPTPSPTPTPAPVPPSTGYVKTASLEGGEALIASFDEEKGLQPAWGTGGIPDLYTADRSEGAFRFTCGGKGKLAYDDPLVHPNKAGASHLHQPWGNQQFNASVTLQSLAESAATNCNDTAYSLNRSAYWMPALLLDSGKAVQPDVISVYYKRATSTSSYCDPNSASFIGICVGLPHQLRFVFGWDATRPTAKVRGASWYCTGGTGKHYTNLDDVFASGCSAGDLLIANTLGPECWDGKHLDTPDHRSHVAYSEYDSSGLRHCPSSHPYYFPQEENKVQWTVTAEMIDAQRHSRIRLSSDGMLPGGKPGETLHADYIERWVSSVKKLWMENCIEKALSCSGGDLGNGKQLIGASKPSYGWTNPDPIVGVPPGGTS